MMANRAAQLANVGMANAFAMLRLRPMSDQDQDQGYGDPCLLQ